MYQPAKPNRYSAAEINAYMDGLRLEYDIVRLVDAEECRIVDIDSAGDVQYGNVCFKIWGRGARCADCSSYRACHTHCSVNKNEYLGNERPTDFGYFGQIMLGLKNQAWFMDNATTWLLCSNDDADDPKKFNKEDLLKHYATYAGS